MSELWPSRIIGLSPEQKLRLIVVDFDRYWSQVSAERAEEARQIVAARLAEVRRSWPWWLR